MTCRRTELVCLRWFVVLVLAMVSTASAALSYKSKNRQVQSGIGEVDLPDVLAFRRSASTNTAPFDATAAVQFTNSDGQHEQASASQSSRLDRHVH